MPDLDTQQDDDLFLLNGSALTMRRLDGWIKETGKYAVADDIPTFRACLLQLYNEGQGYLKPKERGEAEEKIKVIKESPIYPTEDGYGVMFDDDLPDLVHDFHRWLMLKLHDNEATMGKKRGFGLGLAGLSNRYMKPPEAPGKKKGAA